MCTGVIRPEGSFIVPDEIEFTIDGLPETSLLHKFSILFKDVDGIFTFYVNSIATSFPEGRTRTKIKAMRVLI